MKNDQWRTPDWLWEELNKEFNFDIDLCATKENSKTYLYCKDFLKDRCFTLDDDKVEFDMLWSHNVECAFINPPYSNPKPFIEKAWEDSKHCKIVCLVKCDPSTKWWSTFWIYNGFDCDFCGLIDEYGEDKDCCSACGKNRGNKYNGPKPGCSYPYYFPKRIQFDPPIELVKSGEVWSICTKCDLAYYENDPETNCLVCGNDKFKWVQKVYYAVPGQPLAPKIVRSKPLSGPSFSCALLIFDRKNL